MKKLSKKLSDKYKIESLEKIAGEIFFWARRYAHGRNTYVPSTIRKAYHDLKRICPNIKIQKDMTIEPPKDEDVGGVCFRSDYLDDINEEPKA